MDRLWAPWRSDYVSDGSPKGGCFLCAAATGEEASLVVSTDRQTVTLLNRFPYNTGHLMVAPQRHVADLVDAGDDLAAAMMVGARRAIRAAQAALNPDGFNVGVNLGAAAGASIEHVHLHVVPRWSGDTNFMPVAGAVKVLPELLEETAERLRKAFTALD